jgi:hypothetical protein
MAADGMETNTPDPMMTAGLGSVVKGLEDAQQMSRMII